MVHRLRWGRVRSSGARHDAEERNLRQPWGAAARVCGRTYANQLDDCAEPS